MEPRAGIRFSGHQADLKKVSEVKSEKDLAGYHGYVFGCPTYHRDMTENFKTFLFLAQKANLGGRPGAASCSHTHSGESAGYIFGAMENVFRMSVTSLGPFKLKETEIPTNPGLHACQDYGKALAKIL